MLWFHLLNQRHPQRGPPVSYWDMKTWTLIQLCGLYFFKIYSILELKNEFNINHGCIYIQRKSFHNVIVILDYFLTIQCERTVRPWLSYSYFKLLCQASICLLIWSKSMNSQMQSRWTYILPIYLNEAVVLTSFCCLPDKFCQAKHCTGKTEVLHLKPLPMAISH